MRGEKGVARAEGLRADGDDGSSFTAPKRAGEKRRSRRIVFHRRDFDAFVDDSAVVYASNMGNKVATFTDEQLDDYQDVTFFTRKEIMRIFRRYRELDPATVPKTMTGNEAQTVKVKRELLEKMSELKENPYRRRICEAFSDDGSGDLTFDDFLEMFSVFHEQCPREIKLIHAFKIYDYDCDNYIGHEDLEKAVIALTKNQLTPDEVALVCDKVLEESDVDDDGKLSSMEFDNVICRSPDFLSTFHIRI